MASIIPFPLERARGRDSRIAGHLSAARYCAGKARLMASYGHSIAADYFARQAAEHGACIPAAGQIVTLAAFRSKQG